MNFLVIKLLFVFPIETVFYVFFLFFCLKIILLVFLDCFEILMLKIILYFKNIIFMYFLAKNTLKNNHYFTSKHNLNPVRQLTG